MLKLPKAPSVPIEKVDKYKWAYVVLEVSSLLFFFVGAYIYATSKINDSCELEKEYLRKELAEYKKENRELLTANYRKNMIIQGLDSLTRQIIDEQDVKLTVETNKARKR